MERKQILEAIQGGLDFIEAKHGHRGGDVYGDLARAKMHLEDDAVTDDGLIRQVVVKQPGHGPYLWALVWKPKYARETPRITVFSDWMDLAQQRRTLEENGHEIVMFDLAVDNCRRNSAYTAQQALEVRFEWDAEVSRFRLAAYDANGVVVATGGWTTYGGVGTVEFGGRKWVGVSQYFDGVLPTEKALEVFAR